MKISSVELDNVKGRSCVWDFSGAISVLLGPPFSGKTAVLDGLKVGLIGYLPKLGKRASDTFKLATGPKMSVTLTFDDKKTVTRIVENRRGVTTTRVEGTPPEVSPVLFDLRDYLEMTAKQRIAYVASRVTVNEDEFDPLAVLPELSKVDWQAEPDAVAEAVAEVGKIIDELNEGRLEQGVSVSEFYTEVCVSLRDKAKVAAAMVEQMAGVVGGTSQLATATTPVRNVDAELDKARTALREAERAVENWREAAQRREDWVLNIKSAESWLAAHPDKLDELDKLKKELEEAAVETQKAKRGVAGANINELTAKAAAAKRNLDAASNEVYVLEARVKQLDTEHKENLKKKECPYCKSSEKGWQKHLSAKHAADTAAIGIQLKLPTERLQHAQKVFDEANETLLSANGKLDVLLKASAAELKVFKRYTEARDQAREHGEYRAKVEAWRATEPPQAGDAPDTATVNNARELVAQLDTQQRRYIGERSKQAQSAKAATELRKERGRAEVLAKAERLVFAQHENVINDAIKSLLTTARRFTDGLMPGKLDFLEGEIGYMVDGTWVSHEVFSGTEEALAYAGFSVALNQGAALRIVLMDELWRAGDLAPALVKRMTELQAAGVIDQFIGASPTPSMARAFLEAGANVITIE